MDNELKSISNNLNTIQINKQPPMPNYKQNLHEKNPTSLRAVTNACIYFTTNTKKQ